MKKIDIIFTEEELNKINLTKNKMSYIIKKSLKIKRKQIKKSH